VLVKQLDAARIAVGHVQDPARIQNDLMRQANLARPGAVLTAGFDGFALRVEMDHAPITVAVAHEDIAGRHDGRIGPLYSITVGWGG
jgi:hypothetical protein